MVDIQNGINTVWVNANHGRDFHPLSYHMTKLKKYSKEEIFYFSAFQFSLQLMLEHVLINLIVCLMISQKLHIKVAQTS